MSQYFRLLLLAALSLLAVACSPAYTAPVRVFNNLPPGRFEQQTIEANLGYIPATGAAAGIGYAPSDYVKLDIGSDFLNGAMATVAFGMHVSPWPAVRQTSRFKFLNEVELGLGGGAGGECDHGDCSDSERNHTWSERLMLGGFGGAAAGFGYTQSKGGILYWDLEADIYIRARYQYADAWYTPQTHWITYGPGLAFRMEHFLRVYLSPVFARYWNRYDVDETMAWEIGIELTFDLIPGQRVRAAYPAYR